MVDLAEWVAIILGVLSFLLAIWGSWDSLLVALKRPVYAKQLSIRTAPEIHFDSQHGRQRLVIVNWRVRSRLTYPITAMFGYTGIDPTDVPTLELGGDAIGPLAGTVCSLPPREPLTFWFRLYVKESRTGEITPEIHFGSSGMRIRKPGKPYRIG